MPVGEGVGGQHGSAATLVRSDQDSGMALVKSKDGRTKWLTVSTDPTSTPPSTTWDERVRTWASMLGVCAPPPSPPSSKRHNNGTPLPTPPPDSPAWGGEERGGRHQDKQQQQQQQQQHWPPDRDDDSSAATAAAAAAAVANDSTAATGTNSPASAAAASPGVGVAASTARRKPVATGKRVGSFARGFLLGLGGGGSGSGGGGGGGGGGASKRSKNPTGNAPAHAAGKGGGAVVAPASTLPPQTREAGEWSIVQDGRDGVTGDDMAVVPSTPVATMAVAGADDVTGGRRQRWVKGAPPSPGDSDDSDSDGDVTCRSSKGGVEGASPCGTCSPPPPPAAVAAAAPAPASAPAPAPAGGDAEGMEWLETGPGGNVAAKASSGGTKTIGGGGGGGSKKKKKNKGKGKGGGGGGGAKATKNASSSLPSAAAENKTTGTQPVSQSSSGQQEPCATLNGAAAGRVKAKRAKGGKKLSVSFGRVNLVEFTRDVGGCGVPSDGTWGLALGLPFRETVVDVDGYETSRAEILEERTSELSRKQRHLSTGETRQFDYRPVGEKNPLFYRLGEKERSKKLLDYACFHKSDLEEADRDSEAVQTPDDSAGTNDNNSHIDGSGRKGTSDFNAYSHKVSHADFVDKSQEASVELTALRDSRKNSQGCSCSYVRPEKLNLAKLRAELTKRGLKASGSKKDLVKVLQEAMRQDEEKNGGKALKVCRSEECQCVQDGVECHADLCSCCKGPSIGEKDAHHGGNCGNPEGVYAYSSSVVRSHRGPYVTSKVVPGRERGGGHGRSDSVCSDHH